MFVIFYFLLIRPQQKKQKQHQEMIANLKKGDKVLTGGSIYGQITSVGENDLTVEIAKNVRVKVARGSIAALVSPQQQAQAKKGEKE
jgi:preprotein translocase subunit YajC